jgi:hypothetical protein
MDVNVFRPELAAALGTERFLREIETTANAASSAGKTSSVAGYERRTGI